MNGVQIEVSATTLERLQKHSTQPLLETPDLVICRILDLLENHPPPPLNEPRGPHAKRTEYFETSRGVLLPVGLELRASYRGSSPRATVTAKGIRYNDKVYEDPSAAARAAKIDAGASEAASSTNGWVFWMIKPAQSPNGRAESIDIFRKDRN